MLVYSIMVAYKPGSAYIWDNHLKDLQIKTFEEIVTQGMLNVFQMR